jgi:hypothetical protein
VESVSHHGVVVTTGRATTRRSDRAVCCPSPRPPPAPWRSTAKRRTESIIPFLGHECCGLSPAPLFMLVLCRRRAQHDRALIPPGLSLSPTFTRGPAREFNRSGEQERTRPRPYYLCSAPHPRMVRTPSGRCPEVSLTFRDGRHSRNHPAIVGGSFVRQQPSRRSAGPIGRPPAQGRSPSHSRCREQGETEAVTAPKESNSLPQYMDRSPVGGWMARPTVVAGLDDRPTDRPTTIRRVATPRHMISPRDPSVRAEQQ